MGGKGLHVRRGPLRGRDFPECSCVSQGPHLHTENGSQGYLPKASAPQCFRVFLN